jgi:hypothetical protein
LLKNINNINIENETKRIQNECGFAEIFDDLIRAIIKSHITDDIKQIIPFLVFNKNKIIIKMTL